MTISERVASYAQVITAGTTAAAPNTLAIEMGDVWLWEVIVRTPDGPKGTVGYAVTFNGVNIIPWSQTPAWYVPNDEIDSYPVDAEVDNFLNVVAYNTDVFAHTLYWRFFYTPIALIGTAAAPTSMLPIS